MSLAVSFLVSFGLTALLTPLMIRLAFRMGWVAAPRPDRWHRRPTALMGGTAIFLGTVASWLWVGGQNSLAVQLSCAGAAAFLLGFLDDRFRLRASSRLASEIAMGAALIAGGTHFGQFPEALAVPLTLFWLVGIPNAVNLLDNMDGLAAGVAGITALSLGLYGGLNGSVETAQTALALAGGCAGFLLYNFHPAKVFMGDCGSLFIGFSLAVIAVRGTASTASNLALSLAVPVALLAVPIFDTTLVSVTRILHGRRVSEGGRDHTSHRLVTLGLSERDTVLALYGITCLFGGLALVSPRLPLATAVLGAVCFVGLAFLGVYLGLLKVYPEESQPPPNVRVIGGVLQDKKQLLQVILDTLWVPVAFVGAHLLRFEGELPAPVADAVLRALPWALAAKLVGLAVFRAHRGVWRVAGLTDALRTVGGSTAGSLLTVALLRLTSAGDGLSNAALIMDWLLFTLLATLGRLAYTIQQRLFGLIPPKDGPRVLILGAGPEARSLIQQLRDPLSPFWAEIIGVLDTGTGRQGRSLDGVPVLGSLSDLPALLEREKVAWCFLGSNPASPAGRGILDFCRERSVPLYPASALHPGGALTEEHPGFSGDEGYGLAIGKLKSAPKD